jgi:hypothetical protein
VPSRQREGKQKVDPEDAKDEEMEYQDAKRALKAVYDHSTSCTGAPGILRLGALSRPCVEQWRRLHLRLG